MACDKLLQRRTLPATLGVTFPSQLSAVSNSRSPSEPGRDRVALTMPLAHTPPRAQPHLSTNTMHPAKKTELTNIISDKLRLSGLHAILNIFLTTPNRQTEFPFYLPREEVLNIFSVDSHLAAQMTEIMKGTSCSRSSITVHELLTYVTEALEALITDPTITDNPKEGFELLLASVQT